MLFLPLWCLDAKGGEVDLLGRDLHGDAKGLVLRFGSFDLGIKPSPSYLELYVLATLFVDLPIPRFVLRLNRS